jgi:hypothetical protein
MTASYYAKHFVEKSSTSDVCTMPRSLKIVFTALQACALSLMGCDYTFMGGQQTSSDSAALSYERKFDDFVLQYKLQSVKYSEFKRLYIWCGSSKTLGSSGSDPLGGPGNPDFKLVTLIHIPKMMTSNELESIVDKVTALAPGGVVIVNPARPSVILNACTSIAIVTDGVTLQDAISRGDVVEQTKNSTTWWNDPPMFDKFQKEANSPNQCFDINPHYVKLTDKGFCVCSRNDGKDWDSHIREPDEKCK